MSLSAVIMNWKRPDNVRRIVDNWEKNDLVTEAIVWNNNPEIQFSHDWAKVINSSHDLGLYTRFAGAMLAKNEAVLIQDDDLEFSPSSLQELYDFWEQDPDVIHGVYGRGANEENEYRIRLRGELDVPIVLTRGLIAHRKYADDFFNVVRAFADIQEDSIPYGNGEDIIFNYVARKSSGRLNRLHRVENVELEANDPIWDRTGMAHLTHRTDVMRACEQWLKEVRPDAEPVLDYTKMDDGSVGTF